MGKILTKKRNSKVLENKENPDKLPVLYTDNINMTANKYGVILNIMQRTGISNEGHIVSRIGMSRVHAKEFVEKLGRLLMQTEKTVDSSKSNLN